MAGKPVPNPKESKKEHSEHKNLFREVIETVVFVVVLVLMLKTFVAEAFVIPTGSMAETLYGHQKIVICSQCGYQFPVNASKEVEEDKRTQKTYGLTHCSCPNCLHKMNLASYNRQSTSGDRVLVAKFLWELTPNKPNRFDVVVFKFPERPVEDQIAKNYIKRLIGLPGETICIWGGDLYVNEDLTYTGRERPENKSDLWKKQYRYENDHEAQALFKNDRSRFPICRKPPAVMLAESRIVNDNDHQPKDLNGLWKSRWEGATALGPWRFDNEESPKVMTYANQEADAPLAWLHYRHLLAPGNELGRRQNKSEPEFITDFIGYNTGEFAELGVEGQHAKWVGDLMIDCQVKVNAPTGQFILEVSEGVNRFQARWSLATGDCTLVRIRPSGEEELAKKPTSLKAGGDHHVRFANYDDRLTVWVDGELPFGAGQEYTPDGQDMFTKPNDLEPASIGAQGANVKVSSIKLWRDTYYTSYQRRPDLLSDEPTTFYVQPGHYFCLGDNSPQSADSREWGTVPERLMLGRALMVYYPVPFDAWPFYSPVNRVGPIN